MNLVAKFSEAAQNQAKGDLRVAMTQLDAILIHNPKFHPAWIARATILQKLGHPFDAILNYDRAVELEPSSAGYYNDRGTAKMDLEDFDGAMADFKSALNRDNKIPEMHSNRGNVLTRQRKPLEAIEAYKKALELKPDYNNARIGLSMALLMSGQLTEGFKEFESRWGSAPMIARKLPYPVWGGERAKDTNDILLIYGEQGMGDTLQFCRYAEFVKNEWQGKVYLEVQHPLARLMKGVAGVDGVLTIGEKIPAGTKACIAMLSVPRVLGTTLETIPNHVPYIPYDSYRASLWQERLKALPAGPKVGICWAGMNRDHDPVATSVDSRRSMLLQQFKPFGAVQGISWVSLQLGPPKDQITTNPAGLTIGDWTSDLYDFFDTAALVQCLDLVISVDTAVAHVAGALGKPVWLLSRYDACWRWLMDYESDRRGILPCGCLPEPYD